MGREMVSEFLARYIPLMLATRLIDHAIECQTRWLNRYDTARADRFQIMARNDKESAAAEALIRQFLRRHTDEVEPFENLSKGGPDFRCRCAGNTFYVEVTSLSTSSAERASWIPDDPHWEGGNVGSISRLLRNAVSGKVRQCLRRDAPTLVAIGLLHSWVSMGVDRGTARDMLISDESYVVQISPKGPIPTRRGDFVTGLRNALFYEAVGQQAINKRNPVSAVLVFGLGVGFPPVIGALNPHAARPFDPSLLPSVEFAQPCIESGRVGLRWYNEHR
jgi:hypothetical protein